MAPISAQTSKLVWSDSTKEHKHDPVAPSHLLLRVCSFLAGYFQALREASDFFFGPRVQHAAAPFQMH